MWKGLELINISEMGQGRHLTGEKRNSSFTFEVASRWESPKIFQNLEELTKYLDSEKIEIFYAEKRFQKYNIPRFVLINPFTIFKPDDEMIQTIKHILPTSINKDKIPLWRAKQVESSVRFSVQEFSELPVECDFIANLDLRPASPNPSLSIQYCLALDEIYVSHHLATKSKRAESNLLANDAAIEYAGVSGMKCHLQGIVNFPILSV